MILVTRINGAKLMINPDLIELMEKQADTIVSLTTGNRILVKESLEELSEKIVQYRRKTHIQAGG